ncbi:hypothetical protein FACS1894199_08980 [Bacteroidia bacterium]|nr:hypothetical protein FACS1894199_08980 [Bacteroidia bacterium]
MKLSIIIALYNAEKYIVRCLESTMNHSLDLDDYEVIVIDDGSTDSSLSLVEEFGKNHPNIKILTKNNGGQGSARNMGLYIAQGKYILFLDSDDYLESDKLRDVLIIAEQKKIDILSFCFNTIDENYNLIKTNQSFCRNIKKVYS